MEHDILFGNSNRGNGTTFLDFPLFLEIFQRDEPTKRVPFTAQREIPGILTNGKRPWFPLFPKLGALANKARLLTVKGGLLLVF